MCCRPINSESSIPFTCPNLSICSRNPGEFYFKISLTTTSMNVNLPLDGAGPRGFMKGRVGIHGSSHMLY
ncbi:hypothetical protein FRX31_027674 [Thalictrum thalictroides]|uniref:Uncharacterized protein n=1 Tax=Thalictrum thalictroides TaxID=46969 RepID=A0A7J6VC99_THATH|nr:hypothetical protein FRX31_027674 [Thalictrum thalictroides]